MAKILHTKIGPRDIEILNAIDRCPLTSAQLFDLGTTFQRPFQQITDLRRRLRKLRTAGLLNSWPYAIAGEGRSPHYFKLSRDGFRLLYGESAALPKRRHFEALRPGHHHHTISLAQLVVHLTTTAVRHGHRIESYARENSVCLKAEPFTIYPDAAFIIRRSDGRSFPFCVELDNGTERVRSKQDVESIERKLRGYDAHQSQFGKFDSDRYLVLFVTTRSQLRLQHIMDLAGAVMRQPQRTVFIGCSLTSLIQCDPFVGAGFVDHRGLKRTLIPKFHERSKNRQTTQRKTKTVVV